MDTGCKHLIQREPAVTARMVQTPGFPPGPLSPPTLALPVVAGWGLDWGHDHFPQNKKFTNTEVIKWKVIYCLYQESGPGQHLGGDTFLQVESGLEELVSPARVTVSSLGAPLSFADEPAAGQRLPSPCLCLQRMQDWNSHQKIQERTTCTDKMLGDQDMQMEQQILFPAAQAGQAGWQHAVARVSARGHRCWPAVYPYEFWGALEFTCRN